MFWCIRSHKGISLAKSPYLPQGYIERSSVCFWKRTINSTIIIINGRLALNGEKLPMAGQFCNGMFAGRPVVSSQDAVLVFRKKKNV